jgi:hypothetical protein
MGGQPRTTSGDAGLQDGSTPAEFIAAVERRFGPISFDLAAHRTNKKHARYFAPKEFTFKYDPEKPFPGGGREALLQRLERQGALRGEAEIVVGAALESNKKGAWSVPNRDPRAVALDALAQPWAPLTGASKDWTRRGLLWLNCEWADVAPWATKCLVEAVAGANIVLLTHVAIADWARNLIFGRADVHLLSGRMSFDGKNVLPKDCMLSHFHPEQSGRLEVWDWRRQATVHDWCRVSPRV